MENLREILKATAEATLGFLYPEVCQLCETNRAKREEGYVCSICWQRIRFIRPPYCEVCGLPFEGDITTQFECTNCCDVELHFKWARSAVVAKGPVLEAIHRYKYTRHLWFEEFLADLLIREAKPMLAQNHWDGIIPVPLHSLKQRDREFNQAERLGQRLSDATTIPLLPSLLKRAQPTRTQTRLSRKERAENVHGAFKLKKPVSLKGKRLLVVDDVFTTGATTSACARVLKKAGAEVVAVWTVARGVPSARLAGT